MTTDQFMLWRFRFVEGVLDNIKSWNMNECVFNDGSKITYDTKNELMTITTKTKSDIILFSKVTKEKLEEFGFTERLDNRHSSSFNTETVYSFQYR